jgi:peptidoglycan/LPS O-acetylase OafA/YrhL
MSIVSPDQLLPVSVLDDTTTTKALARHQNNFNLLRVLLAVSVIFSHCYPIMYGPAVYDPIERFLHAQRDAPTDHPIDLGHLAVYGFFVISGYLITMSWQNSSRLGLIRGLGDYGKKRFLRIYPGLLANLLFCAFLVAPFAADNSYTYWHELWQMRTSFIFHTLLGQMKMPNVFNFMPIIHSVNGALWSIELEIRCYFLVAMLGLSVALIGPRLPKRMLSAAPLLLFSVIYIYYALCCSSQMIAVTSLIPVSSSSFPGHLLTKINQSQGIIDRMLLYFLSGMCFYLYRAYVTYRWPFALAALAILLSAIYIVPVIAYMLPIAGAYLLLYVAFLPLHHIPASLERTFPFLAFSAKWFREFGKKTDLSYGLYLYAFPIQQLLIMHYGSYFYKAWSPIGALFVTASIIASGLALLSWHFVEKPSLRLKSVTLPSRLRLATRPQDTGGSA